MQLTRDERVELTQSQEKVVNEPPVTPVTSPGIVYAPTPPAAIVNEPVATAATPAGTVNRSSGTPPTAFRALLWVLVLGTLVGSILITYLITSHFSNPKTAPTLLTAAPVATAIPSAGTKAKAAESVPTVAGAIAGAEQSVPNPQYTAKAGSEPVSDMVTVLIRVNRAGGVVIAAHALNGERDMRIAAEEAARKAKFVPEKLPKETKVVSGTITYQFGSPDETSTAENVGGTSENDLPTVGGALAGTQISVPQAEYPENAKRKGASGDVMVVVRVIKGEVVAARALGGASGLRATAVKAARKARFSAEKLAGEGKVVSGTITYHFGP